MERQFIVVRLEGHDRYELVTTQTCNLSALSNQLGRAIGDLAKQLIACCVP